jgi:hypothetical protein
MLRGALIAFVAGWVLWFWLDKSPAVLGRLPHPEEGDYLRNFQVTIDLVKQGRVQAAFIYIWKAHYLVLSLGVGLVLGMGFASLSRAISRNRLLKLYLPARESRKKPPPPTP